MCYYYLTILQRVCSFIWFHKFHCNGVLNLLLHLRLHLSLYSPGVGGNFIHILVGFTILSQKANSRYYLLYRKIMPQLSRGTQELQRKYSFCLKGGVKVGYNCHMKNLGLEPDRCLFTRSDSIGDKQSAVKIRGSTRPPTVKDVAGDLEEQWGVSTSQQHSVTLWTWWVLRDLMGNHGMEGIKWQFP